MCLKAMIIDRFTEIDERWNDDGINFTYTARYTVTTSASHGRSRRTLDLVNFS